MNFCRLSLCTQCICRRQGTSGSAYLHQVFPMSGQCSQGRLVWPGRLLHVRLPVGNSTCNHNVDIRNTYQYIIPGDRGRGLDQQNSAESKVEKREKLLHTLAGLLGQVPYRNCLPVAGDLSASLLPCSSLIGPAVQHSSKHNRGAEVPPLSQPPQNRVTLS